MTDPVRIGPERRSTTQPSSLNSEPIKEENEDITGESLVVKKMKTGDIDPSKAIPADAVSIVLSGAGKTKKASKDKNVTRLTHLKDQLSESKTLQDVVTDIQVSADDMKLIFRGNQSEEAYLFVLFGATEKAGHHAVVKSENDAFRSAILEAIANL